MNIVEQCINIGNFQFAFYRYRYYRYGHIGANTDVYIGIGASLVMMSHKTLPTSHDKRRGHVPDAINVLDVCCSC